MASLDNPRPLTRFRLREPRALFLLLFFLFAGPLNPGQFLFTSELVESKFAKEGQMLEFYILPSSIVAWLAGFHISKQSEFEWPVTINALLGSFGIVVIFSPFIVSVQFLFTDGLSDYFTLVMGLYFFGFLFGIIPFYALTVGVLSVACMVPILLLMIKRVED